jgi:plasmid stability protein
MRTTIRLDDALLRRAKARAAAAGRSLNDFIEDAVRAALARAREAKVAPPLPTFAGGGLQPGVDLDDNAALLDLMDAPGDYLTRAARRARPLAKVAERPRGRRK